MKERIKSKDGGRSEKKLGEKKSKMSFDRTGFVSKSFKILGGRAIGPPLKPPISTGPAHERKNQES